MGKNFVPPETSHSRKSPTGWACHGCPCPTGYGPGSGGKEGGAYAHKAGKVANLYRQVAEINKAIAERPEGERFPSSKEADILGKLSAAIRNMEQEVGIADIISVLTGLIDWVRAADLEKAKEITRLADAYIKDKL